MNVLKKRKSANQWYLPKDAESQCNGSEWSRKSNLSWTGISKWGNYVQP